MSLKRPAPVTSCTECGNAGYNPSLIRLRCGKTIADSDCKECPCNGIGAEHIEVRILLGLGARRRRGGALSWRGAWAVSTGSVADNGADAMHVARAHSETFCQVVGRAEQAPPLQDENRRFGWRGR
jgi:hypothetical protein